MTLGDKVLEEEDPQSRMDWRWGGSTLHHELGGSRWRQTQLRGNHWGPRSRAGVSIM